MVLTKTPLGLSDVKFDNYCAVMEFVRDYSQYDNAGQSYGMKINEENFTFDSSIFDQVQSKYLFDWNGYKDEYSLTPDFAKDFYKSYDKKIIGELLSLLV